MRLAATALALLLAGPVNAACVPEVEPNDAPEAATPAGAGAFCARGNARGGDQDLIRWQVPQAGLWQLRLETVPGIDGLVGLIGPGADERPTEVWKAPIDPATGLAEGAPLLLGAGPWVVATTTTAQAMRWRIYGAPVETPEAGATSATDAFSAQLIGAGEVVTFDWTVSAEVAGRLWDIGLNSVPGQSVSLQAYAADGTALFWASDPAGGVAAADRSFPAGRYRFELRGLATGAPVILSATAQDAAALVAEPDFDMAQAHEIAVGESLSGRLIAGADSNDSDVFALTVPDDAGQIEIVVDSLSTRPFDVYLMNDEGVGLIDTVTATGSLRLGPYTLPPGRYGIRLSGDQGGATYVIGVESAPPLAPGTEAEPNEIDAYASTVSTGATLRGTLSGPERDHVALEVPPGDLGWWDIAVDGPGSVEMQVIERATGTTTGARSLGAGSGTVLTRLPLAPGRHLLRLTGDGDWALTGRPVAPPGPDEEAEPNDDPLRATPLVPEQAMRFRLDHGGDIDHFSLTPAAPQRVRVRIEAPAEVLPTGTLSRGTQASTVSLDFQPDPADPAGMVAEWEGAVAAERLGVALTASGAAPVEGTVTASLSPPFDRPADVGASEPAAVTLAAGDPRAQAFDLAVAFPGQAGRLTGWVSDGEWQLSGLPPRAEGGTARFRIEAPAWLAPGAGARWAVALQDDTGAVTGLAEGKAVAGTGAPAVGPVPAAPLPLPLIGTLDAAWDALGAVPTGDRTLTDGQVDGTEVPLPLGQGVDIDLAGDSPLPVVGLILTPPATGDAGPRLRHVRIEADDAVVWEGEVSPLSRPQPVVLNDAVRATALRLTALDTWDGGGGPATLSKLSVLVPPGALPAAIDLARPDLGGHVVTASPTDAPLTGEGAAWPSAAVSFTEQDGSQSFWTMGFHDGRAARIGRISATLAPDLPPDARIARLSVEASVDGQLGPWQPLGALVFDGDAAEASLVPDGPVWARALRFTVEGGGRVQIPASLSIIEARGPDGASIIGQWGRLNPVALYEKAHQPPAEAPGLAGGAMAEAAVALPPDTDGAGAVTLDARSVFYGLAVPPDAKRLLLRTQTDGARFTLTDPQGAPVTLTPGFDGLAALIPPGGGVFLLQVSRPADAVVIAWDTSLSVSALTPAILTAVQDMARALAPGVQSMNFVPFRAENASDGGEPLLRDFATDPGTAWGALQSYPAQDSDSDAEAALIVAARALAQEEGRHAVVLLTDASFTGRQPAALWEALAAARPKVFALRIPTGTRDAAARAQAALMQDWAGVNGGEHRLLASSADASRAFRELTAVLARPVPFRVSWQAQATLPEAGRLAVVAPPASATAPTANGRAIEVIIDASGSMLQRVGGTRKIEIARRVLAGLVADTLPPGTPFALRVFGTGDRGACESSPALPLGPLDREVAGAAIAAIKARDGAKTAIAASLAKVPGDLGAAASDGALVVLLTDGEETCGGDPGVQIAALRAGGLDVRLNIVGFDLQDETLRGQFAGWSAAGGGAFFDARDAASLRVALTTALARRFTVRDVAGTVRATGTVGDEGVALEPGTYTVAVEGTPVTGSITLRPGETVSVEAP